MQCELVVLTTFSDICSHFRQILCTAIPHHTNTHTSSKSRYVSYQLLTVWASSHNCTHVRLHLKCDGTHAETRFHLSAKQTSSFKSAGVSVQSTTASRGVGISVSNAETTTFRGVWRVLATHSICQFPLHFPSRASPCAITLQLDSTSSAPISAALPLLWIRAHAPSSCRKKMLLI
jgi:hypothetical protein